MTQNEVKLTPEQESIIIKGILKFVDDNKAIPGNKQLFEAMDKKVPKAEITEFIKKENNKHCNPKYAELMEIKTKFTKEREFGFYKRDSKHKYDEYKTKKAVEEWAKTQDELKLLNENELWKRYENKEFGFKTFTKFYEWNKEQPKECHYCKITQDELDELWDEKLELISSKKFSKALHIERLDPDKPYCKDNCRLSCAVCNNAKSDIISECDFRKCFVYGIKKFYKLLKSRLKK